MLPLLWRCRFETVTKIEPSGSDDGAGDFKWTYTREWTVDGKVVPVVGFKKDSFRFEEDAGKVSVKVGVARSAGIRRQSMGTRGCSGGPRDDSNITGSTT